ncbi:MAG: endo-1,4-beta-xylanase [bacterium]
MNFLLTLIIVFLIALFFTKNFSPIKAPQNENPKEYLARKDIFTIKFIDSQGNPISGTADVKQINHEFIFGAAINPWIMSNYDEEKKKSLEHIKSIFNLVVDESMFKWKNTEESKGEINFNSTKKIMEWARENNKKTRHHCLFWSNPEEQPDWIYNMDSIELKKSIFNRINYTKQEFAQNITSLDVVNEMIAYDFYRSRLGNDIIKDIYKATKINFPDTALYINESPFHLCRDSKCDSIKTKEEYKNFIINEFLSFLEGINSVPYDKIALQAHIQSKSDISANKKLKFNYEDEDFITLYKDLISAIAQKTNKKVLISEFDFYCSNEGKRTKFIEDFYKMAFNHPNVEGIIYWYLNIPESSLTNRSFELNDAGIAINNLINKKWKTFLYNIPTKNGKIEFDAYFGEYEIFIPEKNKTIQVSLNKNSQRSQKIVID